MTISVFHPFFSEVDVQGTKTGPGPISILPSAQPPQSMCEVMVVVPFHSAQWSATLARTGAMKWVQVGVGVGVVVITGVVGTGDSWVYSRLYPRLEQEVAVTWVIPSMVVKVWQAYDCGI